MYTALGFELPAIARTGIIFVTTRIAIIVLLLTCGTIPLSLADGCKLRVISRATRKTLGGVSHYVHETTPMTTKEDFLFPVAAEISNAENMTYIIDMTIDECPLSKFETTK